MKKLAILLGLSLFTLNAYSFSTEDITGEWTCKIVYPQLNIQSLDTFDFRKDGTSIGTGLIFVGKDPNFVYESVHSGRWTLQENILSEISTDFRFARMHSKQAMKRLDNDKNLRIQEEDFYKSLSVSANTEITKIRINYLNDKSMAISHIWDDGTQHSGFCQRSNQL